MKDLIKAVKEKKVILFVGAGLSMNLGLPSWQKLIGFIAEELHFDPNIFLTFGDYLNLAEYYHIKTGSIGPLRSWMDREWHKNVNIADSEIHRLLVELDFPIIYTTNYDRWIERSYDHFAGKNTYTKITDVNDIPAIENSKTQIIKFHGDFDKEDSIVLTESHYFERLNFESALDIKLRADALGKSLLFIGYSLTDINIRLLFYKLNKLWQHNALNAVRPKSYIFTTRPNPIQKEIFLKRGIHTLSSDKFDKPGEALLDFLQELKNG